MCSAYHLRATHSLSLYHYLTLFTFFALATFSPAQFVQTHTHARTRIQFLFHTYWEKRIFIYLMPFLLDFVRIFFCKIFNDKKELHTQMAQTVWHKFARKVKGAHWKPCNSTLLSHGPPPSPFTSAFVIAVAESKGAIFLRICWVSLCVCSDFFWRCCCCCCSSSVRLFPPHFIRHLFSILFAHEILFFIVFFPCTVYVC